MYIECSKRVTEKRTADPNKDTTHILNELLADEAWLNSVSCALKQFFTKIFIIFINF